MLAKELNIEARFIEKINSIERQLAQRGGSVEVSDILNRALELTNEKFWEEILDRNSPFEYHLSQALSDEKKKAQILGIIKGRKRRAKKAMTNPAKQALE